MNVLLVEDDQWVGECYAAWLHRAGFLVHWARDAQSALDALDNMTCHVIVLDLLLPQVNGIQLLTVAASHVDLMDIPVVICSSAIPKAEVDWQAYGVVAVLNKATLTPELFIQKVTEAGKYAIPTN